MCNKFAFFLSFGMADNDNDDEVVPLIEYKVNKTSQAEIIQKFLVQYFHA